MSTQQDTNTKLAAEIADGLTALAGMVRDNPDLADELRYTFGRINVPVAHADDPVATIAELTRAGLRRGADISKEYDDKFGGVTLQFGRRVSLHVYAHREQVCERVVTGTETVTKTVPDPNAPQIEVTETVEHVEWKCHPLLSAVAS